MGNFDITYIFRLSNNNQKIIELRFDTETLDLIKGISENLPAWVNLKFHQCPNCPLTPQSHYYCPVALHLVRLLELFEGLMSYDEIQLDIVTPQRMFSNKTSAQKGMSSLMGLIIAASGCPHTRFFKPMAVRFHLPFTDAHETIYRAASMYLLAQYFHRKTGNTTDMELKGLKDIYLNIQTINTALVKRLQAVSDKDVAVNAVIILDIFAKTVPMGIEQSLEDIRYLFKPYLGQ